MDRNGQRQEHRHRRRHRGSGRMTTQEPPGVGG
jgi:hypothetical protein